jgi:hypothetical protein
MYRLSWNLGVSNNYRHLGGNYVFPLQGSPNIRRWAEKLVSEYTKDFAIGVEAQWEMWRSVFCKVLGETHRKLMVFNWRVRGTEMYTHKYCKRAGSSSWTTTKMVLTNFSGKSVIIYQLTWRHISKGLNSHFLNISLASYSFLYQHAYISNNIWNMCKWLFMDFKRTKIETNIKERIFCFQKILARKK